MHTPKYSTVKQFVETHKAFTEGSIRKNIFNRETNGLLESGAILRHGRKILIDEDKFFHWIQQNNAAA